MWNEIRADVYRLRGRCTVFDVVLCALLARNFRPVFTLRIAQGLARRGFLFRLPLFFVKALHRLACWMAAIDFSWETKIGSGFCITHGWGVVVSPEAKIGKNCTLFHGVTLGRKDTILKDGRRVSGYPILEDEVWVGPHAVIVGAVTVGRGARVAPGAMVFKNVPAGSIVAGNPAKVVAEQAMPDVYNRSDF